MKQIKARVTVINTVASTMVNPATAPATLRLLSGSGGGIVRGVPNTRKSTCRARFDEVTHIQ